MTTDTDTRTSFARIWHMLTLAWPNATHPRGRSTLYAMALAAFTLEEIEDVAQELILLGGEWFPSVSDFYTRLLHRRDGAPDFAAAWAEAVRNASASDVRWSHPAVREAAHAVGGLLHIRSTTNPATMRAQYRDMYTAILERRNREYASGRTELPPPSPAAEQLPNARWVLELEAARG